MLTRLAVRVAVGARPACRGMPAMRARVTRRAAATTAMAAEAAAEARPTRAAASEEEAPERAENIFGKVAFIGCGKMAEALMAPLVQSGLQTPGAIQVYDVATSSMARLHDQYGVHTSSDIAHCLTDADLIVYAVKPQNCETVNAEICRARAMEGINVRADATLLSIVAGQPVNHFINGTKFTKIARAMPNTPAMIGQGVTVWCCTSPVPADERDKIKAVLGTFGKAIYVDDEQFVDMSTSISGSGPAYIFMLMEAMVDAGVHMGFSRDVATALVNHTLLGSTLFAMKSGEHPALLRNSVTSPAGTTASALYELENGKFRVVIKDAIWACYRRALELGGNTSNVGPGRMAFTPPFEAPIAVAPRTPSTELTSEHFVTAAANATNAKKQAP
eukprot:TRINITY_DN4163_c0_g2_i1.p1 TRINITY_DN4163_c0_g2~~TRINITY_DN4163_c0_g2_i1.p1  ORF type:complete len:390 (+),score=122.49 TRINITY_DN4163_c0_g2_i1:52-1221(+)